MTVTIHRGAPPDRSSLTDRTRPKNVDPLKVSAVGYPLYWARRQRCASTESVVSIFCTAHLGDQPTISSKNDDQVDSTVYALAWSTLHSAVPGILQYYKNEAARLKPNPNKYVRIQVPPGLSSHWILITGRAVNVPESRVVEVTQEEAGPTGMQSDGLIMLLADPSRVSGDQPQIEQYFSWIA
jgi:hypothetical protein